MNEKRALSPAEHAAISQAIRSAEETTSGEIVCVVARTSDDYFFPAAAVLLIFVLAGSFAVGLCLEYSWITLRLPVFVLAQALAASSGLLLLKVVPALRLALTPHGLRERAVRANAVKQFLARNVHRTQARTGVLIFVSLAERRAELLADSGINEKTAAGTWDGMVARLTAQAGVGRLAEALVDAVEEAGRLLAAHFPPHDPNPDELGDHLIEI